MINEIQICYYIGKKERNFEKRNSSNNSYLGLSYSKFQAIFFIFYTYYFMFGILLQATALSYHARMPSYIIEYKNFDTGKFHRFIMLNE